MFSDAGILHDELFQDRGDGLLPLFRQQNLASLERLHRVVTGTPRGQEDDGRGQMLVAEGRDQINRMDRRRHATSFPWKWPPARNRLL